MTAWRPQENLSDLLHAETLLSRMERPKSPTYSTMNSNFGVGAELTTWPNDHLLPTLTAKLGAVKTEPMLRQQLLLTAQSGTAAAYPDSLLRPLDSPLESFIAAALPEKTIASQIFETLTHDVLKSRDRLIAINPSRRKLVERRLEFIGRKIARKRGERLNRSLSLPEVLKESYRDTSSTKLSSVVWNAFVAEVAAYQLLQLFFLKTLSTTGWRTFSDQDLGRLTYETHAFLNQRAQGFAHDKYSWNFARTNLYAWYVPSLDAQLQIAKLLNQIPADSNQAWSENALIRALETSTEPFRLAHLEITEDEAAANFLVKLLETQLGETLVTNFQGKPLCKKFFIPSLEQGSLGVRILDRLLDQVNRIAPNLYDGGLGDETSQLHRAVWGCEVESLELFCAEVRCLINFLGKTSLKTESSCLYRVPQLLRAVQHIGLELHNVDQLTFGATGVASPYQGTASQIQQIENFDYGFVLDHPDRQKSSQWMRAIATQLPYWRSITSQGTNLNWGELHLLLTLSKLRDHGICFYLSHRTLPNDGDGEKLRKTLLNNAVLEAFVEIHQGLFENYKYLYIFRKESSRAYREAHHPRFGKYDPTRETEFRLTKLEEANSTQVEISERGWDSLFTRGAAPIIRHMNHRFPKLYQFASVLRNQSETALFSPKTNRALRICRSSLKFEPVTMPAIPVSNSSADDYYVVPHNPLDLPWIQAQLNSTPIQFWIRNSLTQKSFRWQDLRNCPLIDLSHSPTDSVHSAMEWMGRTKPTSDELMRWSCSREIQIIEKFARYVALSKKASALEAIILRYRGLFQPSTSERLEAIRPDAVVQFYPSSLLVRITEFSEIRISYLDRTKSPLMPENWILQETTLQIQTLNHRRVAVIHCSTKQGPVIQIAIPILAAEFMKAQLETLRNHSWGEGISLLRVPSDLALFSSQVSEITSVVNQTIDDFRVYSKVIDELTMELFEITPEMRQFLPGAEDSSQNLENMLNSH